MKICYPLKKPLNETQPYSGNANPIYAGQGMKGHGAIDYGGEYGKAIHAVHDCFLYSTINMGQSPERYRAVFTLVENGDECYEISFGHVIDCLVPTETYIKKGTPIARMGNFGDVFSGGKYITKEERIAGSTAGTHLHFQIRPCKRVTKMTNGKRYLYNQYGKFKKDGYYYEVINYENGYNGCVDPQPFFDGTYPESYNPSVPTPSKYFFAQDFGKSFVYQKDADELQQILIKLGLMEPIPNNQKGFYGSKTAAAVLKFQIEYISDLSWYEKYVMAGSRVGAKTRKVLNALK